MAFLKLGLLGAFEVRDAADQPLPISAKKNRGLLALLAFSPFLARERLAGQLWSDRGDAQARSSLRQALASLHRDLGAAYASCLTVTDERISLDPVHVEIDAVSFQNLAGRDDAESLRHATLLYRGDLLEDTTINDPAFEEWAIAKRAMLRDLAVMAIEKLWKLEFGPTRIDLAKRLVAIEPLKEFSHLALMQSYVDAGEDGLALERYSTCRNFLEAELGIAPGPEIEALRNRILERGRSNPHLGRTLMTAKPQDAGRMSAHSEHSVPALSDKPSIAVLPFQNLSGDPEQDYFADGVVEEIIIALSRMPWLFVIARNSSFAYKGRSIDVKQVGRELGVRYVLDGSMRKSADKVRITGQLIDAATGTHLWADRFEGKLEDIFALQDQMTASVVGEIAPRLERAEIDRIQHKPTESLDAYDHFLRGLADLYKSTRTGNDAALEHFYRAIDLDPNYASAYGLAARTYVQRNAGGWIVDRAKESAESERLARRAAALGQDDALALSAAALALSDIPGALEDADAFVERSLKLNPNLASTWLFSGWVKASKGDANTALEHLARARQLSPNDPQDFSLKTAMGFAHFIAGRYPEGLAHAEAAERTKPNFLLATLVGAVCGALAGRDEVARKAMGRVLQISPELRVSLVDPILIMRPEDFERWKDGLRKAGLPE